MLSAIDRMAKHLVPRDFAKVGAALRQQSDAILRQWRTRTRQAIPALDHLTIEQFEDSIAMMIKTLAAAMEGQDIDALRNMVAHAPDHGLSRFALKVDPHTLLAEVRILRIVIILELRSAMQRDLTDEEAASFHELFDIIGEHSILAMMNQRTNKRDQDLQAKISGLHRLADLGMLVAGVAHDAANLMLPLRSYIDNLLHEDLPADAHKELQAIEMIVKQFQNTITNLRWLSVDTAHRPANDALVLHEWCEQTAKFHRHMLPRSIQLDCNIPADLPKARISGPAISQAVFNTIRNAQQAIEKHQQTGYISLSAKLSETAPDQRIELLIQDDGPGMPPAIASRALEPFFGTNSDNGGSGLGLALVNSLITRAGGAIAIHSPPPGHERGTLIVLQLQIAR